MTSVDLAVWPDLPCVVLGDFDQVALVEEDLSDAVFDNVIDAACLQGGFFVMPWSHGHFFQSFLSSLFWTGL